MDFECCKHCLEKVARVIDHKIKSAPRLSGAWQHIRKMLLDDDCCNTMRYNSGDSSAPDPEAPRDNGVAPEVQVIGR